MRTDFMASAKQIAWRKKFAKMAKSGKFKKSKKKEPSYKKQFEKDQKDYQVCPICADGIHKEDMPRHLMTHPEFKKSWMRLQKMKKAKGY